MTLTVIDKNLLQTIADLEEIPSGAYNIRKDGQGCLGILRPILKFVRKPNRQAGHRYPGETERKMKPVHIRYHDQFRMHDLVYNTFDIGEDADVLIIAGCGSTIQAAILPSTTGFTT